MSIRESIRNPELYRKERISSEKIENLKLMIKIANKYCRIIIPFIRREMQLEYDRIRLENVKRLQISIIGKRK